MLEPQSDEEKNNVINLDALAESVRNGSYFISSSPSLLRPLGEVVPLFLACLCRLSLSDDSVLVGRGGVFDLFLLAGRGLSSLESVSGWNIGRE